MPTYTIVSTPQPPAATGQTDGATWAAANVLAIDLFPWHKSGRKQATEVRLLYDDAAIYAQFICEDAHSFAQFTELNGPVCRDSCVEFFAMVDPAGGPDYFNLEVNCCGTFMIGFAPGRDDRKLIAPELAARVGMVTSVPGPTKDESPDDDGWWVCATLPFDVLSEFTGRRIAPASGTIWRANFYRCGGKTDCQYACWSPMDLPAPDFHRPESFSELWFA